MTHLWFLAALAVPPLAFAGPIPPVPGPQPGPSPQSMRASPARQDVQAPPAAPASPAGGPLTVEAAVAIALDRHPSVRAADFGIVVARSEIGEARAAYYPDLSASAGYSRWERHAFLPEGITSPSIPSTIGPTDDWFAGLSGRYLLFDSGERAARVRAALAAEHVAAAEASQLRQDLVLRVHESFHGLAAAMQAREAAQQERARADEHLRLAEARKAAGAVPGGDVIRARVGVTEARLHVVAAEHLVRVASGQLATAMGLPPETPLSLEVDAQAIEPFAAVDLQASVANALAARPILAAGQSRIDAARGVADAAQSQLGPKLSADWRYGWRDSIWLPEDRDWSVGVMVHWTLFDGGARRSARARARAGVSRAEMTLSADRLLVRQEVWTAQSRLGESYEAARAAEALVADADESLRVARERYQVGAGTLADLLDSEAALARAVATRVESLLDYRTARAALDWATGTL